MSNGKRTALPESPRSCRRGKCELQKTVTSGVWCKRRYFYSLHLALRTARRRWHAPYAHAGRRMTRTLPCAHAYRITGFFRGIRLLRFDRTSFLQKSALQHQSIGKSRKSSVGKTSCDIGSFGNGSLRSSIEFADQTPNNAYIRTAHSGTGVNWQTCSKSQKKDALRHRYI